MKTEEEITKGLDICHKGMCKLSCPYYGDGFDHAIKCREELEKDARELVGKLMEENRALRTELAINKVGEPFTPGGRYWQKICELNRKQEQKGKGKYGVTLEENTTLTRRQRIEHLQEELLDGLKYCEHLKEIETDGITANDYQRAALRTAGDERSGYLLNGVMGLCGESGEVIDIVKKYLHQGHELNTDDIAEELGDCLWYAALIASAIDMELGDIMERNIEKLKERYPDGFDKARSVNRSENGEDG